MGHMKQPDERFHVHDGVSVPTVVLYAKDPDFTNCEEPRFHRHGGRDVHLETLFTDSKDVPGVMERVGNWCCICGIEPTAAFAANQLDTEMAQFHTEDHGE